MKPIIKWPGGKSSEINKIKHLIPVHDRYVDVYKRQTSYFKESENDITGMGYATSVLSDKQEIVYDQEIPLVIQIITSKNEVHSYVVDYFFQPEEYEKYDYEYVYAITVLFSQKPVSELAN